MLQLIAHSVATYAVSFEGFPERSEVEEFRAKSNTAPTKYHGHKLAI